MKSVPIPHLLCKSHPGYGILISRDYGLLLEKQIPTVLDYARCLTDSFRHYGDLEIAPIGMFSIICQSFQTLLESDEPEDVLPARTSLKSALHHLNDTFVKMSRAFPLDSKVRQLYADVSQSLYAYADSLVNAGCET